ncbi:hypothetical protein SDC9_55617 [bioreactor metagenome]|uniref:Peptidase M50 domain-containing protein n=1 Tax=bioreactor metagenome TaxID=1076179 RepID=A0A644X0A6_9ZZZZ
MYIVIAIFMFGILVAVHELGHFFAAKLLRVKVNEFALGMGPKLLSKESGETVYSLRAFPVGGFCAMEGEDEETDDPRAFTRQKAWKRFIILAAGAFMNFLVGLILLLAIFSKSQAFIAPVISDFTEGFPLESQSGLLSGDRFVKIDGERIYVYSDVLLLFSRSNGETMDLVINRGGKEIALNDFPLKLRDYTVDGETVQRYGIVFTVVPATIGSRMSQSFLTAVDFVRLVRMGIMDLISGTAGLKDLSGPIGIVGTISNVGEEAPSVGDAMWSIAYYAALIAVNLAVVNLLPLPALDGGRIFFLVVGGLFTAVTRKKIDPKYEGYVHMAGLVCLLLLMAVVAFNDIARLLGVGT